MALLLLYENWFDPTPTINKDKHLQPGDILNTVYNSLSERAYKRIYKEAAKEEYSSKVLKLVAYSNNITTQKHYQHYKNSALNSSKKGCTNQHYGKHV
eukprot:2686322-Ditylum_brightwellii.AAC.1